MSRNGPLAEDALDPVVSVHRPHRTEIKRKPEVYFHDTVVKYTPNGNCSAGTALQPPLTKLGTM